jgi:hypothetical protein
MPSNDKLGEGNGQEKPKRGVRPRIATVTVIRPPQCPSPPRKVKQKEVEKENWPIRHNTILFALGGSWSWFLVLRYKASFSSYDSLVHRARYWIVRGRAVVGFGHCNIPD